MPSSEATCLIALSAKMEMFYACAAQHGSHLSQVATEHLNVADVTEKRNFLIYGNLIKCKQSPVPPDYHTGHLDYTAL